MKTVGTGGVKRVGVGTVWYSGRHRCTMWHTWAYLGVGGGIMKCFPLGSLYSKLLHAVFRI